MTQRFTLRALQAAVAASLALAGAAQAESNASAGTTTPAVKPAAVTATLKFSIAIPPVLFLRVGTVGSGATFQDTVTFNLNQNSFNDTPIAAASGGAVTARLAHNLTAGASLGYTVTGFSAAGVPASTIKVSSGNASLPHSADLTTGTAVNYTTLTNGVFDQTATWTYSFQSATVLAAGTYNPSVTYTATAL